MSPDVVIAIAAALGAVATVFGGMHALLVRFERRIEARFLDIDARFDKVDARFDRVDARFDKVDARFAQVESEIVEMKVSLARLEGPYRTLLGLNAR